MASSLLGLLGAASMGAVIVLDQYGSFPRQHRFAIQATLGLSAFISCPLAIGLGLGAAVIAGRGRWRRIAATGAVIGAIPLLTALALTVLSK